MNSIAVSPANGSFGFIIKIDDKKVMIPGYCYDRCDMEDDEKNEKNEKNEIRFILEEDFGCSYNQVNLIKYFIQSNKSGYVDGYGCMDK